MKGMNGAKLLVVHPPPNYKAVGGNGSVSPPASPVSFLLVSPHRLWLVIFMSFFTCASLLTFLSTAGRDPSSSALARPSLLAASASSGAAVSGTSGGLPSHVFAALVHYASAGGDSTPSMPAADMRAIAAVLRRRGPCNLLVFGLGGETPLWRALNHGGRTVFLDENQYYVAHLEERHPGLEAYDVVYATTVREFSELMAAAHSSLNTDCRPVQNLLFSECRLAINDLPNHIYDVEWDIILVDGPRGYTATSPGRMAAIFTASVMARSKRQGAPTDVLVHDYDRAVEQECGREFLCDENLAGSTSTPSLGHYVLRGRGDAGGQDGFCGNSTTPEAASA